MLRFVQHDSAEHAMRFFCHPERLFPCHSERQRGIQCGCCASLSMTKGKMRFVQHDRQCHSERLFLSFRAPARNPLNGCFTSFSMTRLKRSFRAKRGIQYGCFALLSMTRREMRIFFRVCIHLIFENNLAKLAGAVWLRVLVCRQTMQ